MIPVLLQETIASLGLVFCFLLRLCSPVAASIIIPFFHEFLLFSEIDFYCHGTWQDNDTTYTIVSSSQDKKQYCLTHSGSPDAKVLKKMTINSGSCPHPSAGPASPFPAYPLPNTQSTVLHQVQRRALVLNLLDHGMYCQQPEHVLLTIN